MDSSQSHQDTTKMMSLCMIRRKQLSFFHSLSIIFGITLEQERSEQELEEEKVQILVELEDMEQKVKRSEQVIKFTDLLKEGKLILLARYQNLVLT